VIRSLPDKPGIYQYLNADGVIIYIGKAKNLKKRVASYFNKESSLSGKISILVSKIADIKPVIVETELDALLLENNLIKKYQPKYNIQLKDDKTFPWICIKNEAFPRIFPTRNVVRDGSIYFGPYASVRMMNTLLDLVRQLYQIRTCRHNLTPENIKRKKFKVCLQYHIKNCKGPCEDLQTEEDYDQTISEIRDIVKGNITSVIQRLKELMKSYSDNYEFERAQTVKEKIELLEKYRSKSTVVNPRIHDVDVFSIETDDKFGFVNFIKVINGAIIQSHTVEIKKKLDEPDKQILSFAITDLRNRFESQSPEVLVPIMPDMEIPDVKFHVPKRGDKKQLLELSQRNVKYYRLDKQKQKDLVDPERHSKRILQTMKDDLRLKELPKHIECFDNSNCQNSGRLPRSSHGLFSECQAGKKGVQTLYYQIGRRA